jgi:hypothetical protein
MSWRTTNKKWDRFRSNDRVRLHEMVFRGLRAETGRGVRLFALGIRRKSGGGRRRSLLPPVSVIPTHTGAPQRLQTPGRWPQLKVESTVSSSSRCTCKACFRLSQLRTATKESSKATATRSPALGRFCHRAYYGERAAERLQQQLEPPPPPALCFLPRHLRPLRVLAGSSAGSILSSPPRIYPALPSWTPRAEPLPSPGDRPELRLHHGPQDRGADPDRPLGTLHSRLLARS